jgi:hypothetical protein
MIKEDCFMNQAKTTRQIWSLYESTWPKEICADSRWVPIETFNEFVAHHQELSRRVELFKTWVYDNPNGVPEALLFKVKEFLEDNP